MNSERQKREKEIEKLVRGADGDLSAQPDVTFKEQIRKAASTIIDEETSRIQKTERPERPKRSISPMTAGIWLLVLGAGLAFSIPSLGALLIVCGIAAVVWAKSFKTPKSSKQ